LAPQNLIALRLGFLTAERTSTISRPDAVKPSRRLNRAIRKRFFLPVSEKPIRPTAIRALMNLRLLHPHLTTSLSGTGGCGIKPSNARESKR
jgi:hypothetical protein